MAKNGLDKWFKQKWVDIGSKKKGGGHKPCGRKSASGSKRKYPKCVPAAKAARMTDSQKRSAVARKRSKPQGVGGKPTNVKTFARKKAATGGSQYIGPAIKSNYAGTTLSNKSSLKYYGDLLKGFK